MGRFFIQTYGCQMNEADSELLAGLLVEEGWAPVGRPEDADLVLVNTCAVRERAAARALGYLENLAALKRERGLRIGMVGCLARHLGRSALERLPHLDVLLGPDSYEHLVPYLRAQKKERLVDLRPRRTVTYAGLPHLRSPGVNAWVSVMRGCDRFCTYCVVPYTRGRERSLPAECVLEEVRRAVSEGFVSVTLLGQTVTAYRDEGRDLAWLLQEVARIEGLLRIRFLAPYPGQITERLVGVMATEPKVCKHVHLPLQSGSDRVLEGMHRGYTSSEFVDLVDRMRAAVPGLAVTTDLMVGFPGETEEDYDATLSVMRRLRFDGAFMFAYSERPGTAAARRMKDNVPREVKRARLEKLIALQESHSLERFEAFLGKTVEVLVESEARKPQGWFYGRSDDFKDVIFRPLEGEDLRAGVLVSVLIEEASAHTLKGRQVPAAGT